MVVVRLSFRALGKTFHVEDLLNLDLTKGREKARKKERGRDKRKKKEKKENVATNKQKKDGFAFLECHKLPLNL